MNEGGIVFSGEVWFRRVQMTRVYNDARDVNRCVVYRWYERERQEDCYLDEGWDLANDAARDVEHSAGLVGRRVVGTMEYAYVWDLTELDRNTRRHVKRMRRRTEYRPWYWSRMVLVRAWQPTVPIDVSSTAKGLNR
ncbi:hypothetical protein [Streptomyces sp. bgisy153]|uniref:hypothetical protein n=1 Tax=Streptomyces sp. bgisy153 TaxID=3413793 RepID=UPI003D70A141